MLGKPPNCSCYDFQDWLLGCVLLKQIYASLHASSQPNEVCAMKKCKTALEVPELDPPLVGVEGHSREQYEIRSWVLCRRSCSSWLCLQFSELPNFPFSASLWVVSIPVVVFLFGMRTVVLCWLSPTDFALSSLQHLMLGWTRTPASARALPSPPGALLPWGWGDTSV